MPKPNEQGIAVHANGVSQTCRGGREDRKSGTRATRLEFPDVLRSPFTSHDSLGLTATPSPTQSKHDPQTLAQTHPAACQCPLPAACLCRRWSRCAGKQTSGTGPARLQRGKMSRSRQSSLSVHRRQNEGYQRGRCRQEHRHCVQHMTHSASTLSRDAVRNTVTRTRRQQLRHPQPAPRVGLQKP